jgi:hypothetical protein
MPAKKSYRKKGKEEKEEKENTDKNCEFHILSCLRRHKIHFQVVDNMKILRRKCKITSIQLVILFLLAGHPVPHRHESLYVTPKKFRTVTIDEQNANGVCNEKRRCSSTTGRALM